MDAVLVNGVTPLSWASCSIAEKLNHNSGLELSWNRDIARLLLAHLKLVLEADGWVMRLWLLCWVHRLPSLRRPRW